MPFFKLEHQTKYSNCTRCSKYRNTQLPESVYYIPNFITIDEEIDLLRQVYASPKPKWTQLSHRRLQNWGGLPHLKGMIAEKLPEWLNQLATKIATCGAFLDAALPPNHVLVNEYLPGQGIMPHTDGPLYHPTVTTVNLGDHAVLDYYHTLDSANSLTSELASASDMCHDDNSEGNNCRSSFAQRRLGSVLLMPRSLIIVKKDMYTKYLHGILEATSDTVDDKYANIDACPGVSVGDTLHRTKPRISLTVRVVPKVLKNRILFGKQ